MSTVLKNFVTIKRTRGDVLNPPSHRTIVEMIQGILRKYDYAGFNDTYKSLLRHLEDFNDPHNVTGASFYEEVIETAYGVYVKMTPTPLSEEDFRTEIVPTPKFLELLRRIILNHWLYNKVKNLDGTVPSTITISLGADWGLNNTPVTIAFGGVLADEDAFINRGWNNPTAPTNVIFDAASLDPAAHKSLVIFHTSPEAPFETSQSGSFGYPIDLMGSSNDLTLKMEFAQVPVLNSVVLSLLNAEDIFEVTVTATGQLRVDFNGVSVFTNIPCSGKSFAINLTKDGEIDLCSVNNGAIQQHTASLDFSTVEPFSTGLVGVPLADFYGTTFGLKELTIYKNSFEFLPAPEILPVILYLPQSTSVPLTGSATSSLNTSPFFPQVGYKLYLTLRGTWVGTVTLQRSGDNGSTWNSITAHDGQVIGSFTSNCDEAVVDVTNTQYRYRIAIAITSGQVFYRLAQ